ncbi:MAG TPA: F0F1 ATP synthase subunit B [Candidatus Saccharimonadales bacterium]|nr:F0F1 ATP synthase subunit B [Candidatus Saccharimonadales bacterium]
MFVFAAEQASGISSLGLNLKSFIFQMITFAIIVFVLNKYALSKLFAVIDKRRETIEAGLKTAEEAKLALTDADSKVAELLQKAHSESNDILAATHKEAAGIMKEAEDKAVARAEGIVKDAQADITQEVEKAREALKSETRQLVAQATEKIIGEKLDASKDASLLQTALKHAEDKAGAKA